MNGPTPNTNYIDLVEFVEALVKKTETIIPIVATDKTYKWEGDPISPFCAYWRSKDIDFVEMFGPESADLVKTVDSVKLFYEDKEASLPVSIHISIDGGINWVYKAAQIGTGDGASKTYTFDFSHDEDITGYFFTFKIECPAATKDFKFTGLEASVLVRGMHFDIA